ncbi:MAG: histidine kinase [Candidatus Kapabacteria bacterium]|nr:histidine kinase [Candidatus Kapabacteria bacterium]
MKGKKFNKFFLSIVLIYVYSVFCQNFNVELIKKDEGLSQSIITCGMEDSHGFMWFGTKNGLNRYDGKEFVVFKHINNDTNSISNNSIFDIAEDKNGFIWILSSVKGINRLDPRTGKSKSYNLTEGKFINYISSLKMLADCDGQLYILVICNKFNTRELGALYIQQYNFKSDKFELFQTDKHYIDSAIENNLYYHDYFVGENGDLIVKTKNYQKNKNILIYEDFTKGDKLYLINPRNETYIGINNYKDYAYVKFLGSDKAANPLIQISNDKERFRVVKLVLKDLSYEETNFKIDDKWYKNGFDINPFYYNDHLFATIKLHNELSDKQKKLFNGLYQFNDSGYLGFDKTNRIHSYSPVYYGSYFLNTKQIFSSKNHIIWDYYNNGLIKIIPKTKRVFTYKNIETDPNSLSMNTIRSVYVDNDNCIWVGTYNGLDKYDKTNNCWTKYFYKGNETDNRKNAINVMTDDEDNNLMIGTNNGVLILNKKNGKYRDITNKLGLNKISKLSGNSIYIWGMVKDGKSLWLGTIGGLYKYEPSYKSYKSYIHNDTIKSSICDLRINTIFKDKKNNIWIGTQNGLNRYLPENDGFKVYLHNPNDSNSICGNNVWSICEDIDGNIWFGAYGSGISMYNPQKDNFSSLTTTNGLPDDGIVSMVCDSDNNLWLGSMKGLIKYDQIERKFTRFTEKDGFQGNEYAYHSAGVTVDNKLVFGGSDGVSIFLPMELVLNKNIPQIVISKLFFKDSLVSYLLKDQDTIKTDWHTDYIKVQFSALDYVAPLRNQYAYKVEGLHKDWIYLGNQNIIILAGIDPGNYILRIKASNNDGVWNENGISINLIISPPFWMTLWFKALIIILILLSIFFYVKNLLKRRYNEESVKRRMISLKLQALQSQMNPHFIFNSLNSIFNLIVYDDKQKAMKYLLKFSKLLRKVIDRLRASTISLEEEIEHINLYFELELLRFDNKFTYSIVVDDKINPKEISVPALFLQPYIENSIKHGQIHQIEHGKIDISIVESGENLLIDIIDNGVGRKISEENKSEDIQINKSFGMDISRERLGLINSEVFVKDSIDDKGKACGTQVSIIIFKYKTQNG